MNQKLTWNTAIICGIFATFLLNTAVQAAELITASTSTETITQPSSHLIASRQKKRLKKKARRRVKSTVTKTALPTESSQAPAVTEPTPPPTPPTPPVAPSAPPIEPPAPPSCTTTSHTASSRPRTTKSSSSQSVFDHNEIARASYFWRSWHCRW
jgi:hypothetical protein